MRLRRGLFLLLLMSLIAIEPTFNAPTFSLEYFEHLAFLAICLVSCILVSHLISTRYSIEWKKAGIKEIEAEDNVLLEGIGVFQGILFIYLSLSEQLVSSSYHLNFLRWTIPLVTVLFYVLRGYGAIKNSPKYRLYSSLLLIYYLTFEIVAFVLAELSKYVTINVGSVNLIPLYFPSSVTLIQLAFLRRIHAAFSIRYGFKRKSS